MGNGPPKEVVSFPENSDYQARIEAAKAGGQPVGAVPMPRIPALDAPPGDRFAGVQSGSTLLTPDQIAERQRSGNFIPGVGSGYAANQPGAPAGRAAPQKPDAFQNPPRPEGGLRPETTAQLEAMAASQKAKETKAESDEDKIKREQEELEAEFDFDEFGNRIHTLLQNKPRREAIEARCIPMKFDDLLIYQEVRQAVPIIPGRYEPTYRSVGGHEELFVKRLMSPERGSETYLRDRFALLSLTLGLYSINGKILESHLDTNGEVDDKLFDVKYKRLIRYPFDLLADMSVNYSWFGNRVRQLLVVDKIKGF